MKNFSVDGIKIKPCPFCGSPAEFTSESKEFVRCSKGLQCPTEALPFSVEDWNCRPIEDNHYTAISALYDVLFITQKQLEEWFNNTRASKRKEEYSELLMGIVKTLTKARKAGFIGDICCNCKDKKCAECSLDSVYMKCK